MTRSHKAQIKIQPPNLVVPIIAYSKQKMWLSLLFLLSISMTVTSKDDKLKEDHCSSTLEGADLAKANMHFAISLYKFISSKSARPLPNIFISPICIYTTLAMLALGARSSTQQQILNTMSLNTTQANKTLKGDFKNFLTKLRTEQGDIELKFSNWLFLEESKTPETQYQQDLANYYNTSIQSIDFREKQNAEQKINEQVSSRTDGKIEDLVSNLENQTLMVLLDYASFNAKWKSSFPLQSTEHGHFKVNSEKSVQVQMMHRVGLYKTFKDHALDCAVVEVPYTDQLVLLLIVPKNGSLDAVQNKLSVQLIEWYLSKTRTSLLDLYIPKITLEQKTNVQNALLNMGMIEAFSDDAELSGISKQSKLKVSRIYHKTLIKIAENVTKSSGADVIQSVTLPRALKMKIDQAFLALVYNKTVKTIMLIGRVMDPSLN